MKPSRRTWMLVSVMAFLLASPGSVSLVAACTQCWTLSTGLNGGVPVDLLDRVIPTHQGPVDTVFAAVPGGSSPGVYKSTNGGASFTLVKLFNNANKLAITGTGTGQNGRLWVATNGGLYYSDNLNKWTKAGGGLPQNNFITFVAATATDSGPQMYANVDHTKVVTGGLWRSLDNGATWTRVQPFADVRAVDTSLGCAGSPNIVFAATHNSAGAPVGAILVSTDNGATWAGVSQVFNNANDILVNCGVDGTHRYVYATAADNIGSVWRSDDFNLNFTFDDSGIAVGSASDLVQTDGSVVATLGAALYTRVCGVDGLCNPTWTQLTTTGLGDLNFVSASTALDPVTFVIRYVASTPTGTWYFQP